MSVQWEYRESGYNRGPVATEQLRSLAKQGLINRWTPIRRIDGQEKSLWRRAGDAKGLFPEAVDGQMEGGICGKCAATLIDNHCERCHPRTSPPPSPVGQPPPPHEPLPTRRKPPMAPAETSDLARYPHLRRYLAITEAVARVFLALGVFGAACVMCYAAWHSLGIDTAAGKAVFFLMALLGSLASLGVVYLWYLVTRASVQIVVVLLDIELNTRRTESNTRE